ALRLRVTYEETVAYLAGLEVSAGWDLKLERMRAALARRGHPEARWPALHVAGTNGKGSTAAMLDAVLTAAGYRSGLYTSPHLVEPAVTAITSVALDHEAWLGHDLAAIAAEKAGIVKPGVPLALGQLPAEAARVVAAHAAAAGAPLVCVGVDATLAETPDGL